MILSELSVIAK